LLSAFDDFQRVGYTDTNLRSFKNNEKQIQEKNKHCGDEKIKQVISSQT
jgi:hypothetical protein